MNSIWRGKRCIKPIIFVIIKTNYFHCHYRTGFTNFISSFVKIKITTHIKLLKLKVQYLPVCNKGKLQYKKTISFYNKACNFKLISSPGNTVFLITITRWPGGSIACPPEALEKWLGHDLLEDNYTILLKAYVIN